VGINALRSGRNPVGVDEFFLGPITQGSPTCVVQPWASGRNPVGIVGDCDMRWDCCRSFEKPYKLDDRKRLTEHLSHFCESSGCYGIYATSLWFRDGADSRVLSQLTGSSDSCSSGAGLCMSFSNTHSK
jgi:hypothetical protein